MLGYFSSGNPTEKSNIYHEDRPRCHTYFVVQKILFCSRTVDEMDIRLWMDNKEKIGQKWQKLKASYFLSVSFWRPSSVTKNTQLNELYQNMYET